MLSFVWSLASFYEQPKLCDLSLNAKLEIKILNALYLGLSGLSGRVLFPLEMCKVLSILLHIFFGKSLAYLLIDVVQNAPFLRPFIGKA